MDLTEAATLLREATTDASDPIRRELMMELIRETYPEVWAGIVEIITSLDEAEEQALRESRISKLNEMFSWPSEVRYAPQDETLLRSLTYEVTTGKISEPGEAPEMTSTGAEWAEIYPWDKVKEKERGIYIAIEGIDGSGKSTQAELLAAYMGAKLIREPGGTQVGEALRSIIKDGDMEMHPLTEVYLFAAARSQLLGEIGMVLDAGINVVSDRSIFSSLAYQVGRSGLDESTVLSVNDEAIYEVPDLVILLDVDEDVALARIGGSAQDVMEDRVVMSEVRERYLKMAHGASPSLRYLNTAPWDVVYATNMDEFATHTYIIDAVNAMIKTAGE